MKVAVLGGTGSVGWGIAKQLAKKHQVIIGSRDPARANEAAQRIAGARGSDYAAAAKEAEVVVIAFPYEAMKTAGSLVGELRGKLVLCPINPIKMEGGILVYGLDRGSAAEELAKILPGSRIATAFNNVPAGFLKADVTVPMDILVAADSRETFEEAAKVIGSIPNLRPMYAGPLSEAAAVERITPLVLNLARLNDTGNLTAKFVSRKG